MTRSQEFMRVRRIGKTYAHPLLVLIAAPMEGSCPKIGLISGKSLGNAVTRNRARRRLRAAVDTLAIDQFGLMDCIVIARKPLLKAKFPEISAALRDLILKVNLDGPSGT